MGSPHLRGVLQLSNITEWLCSVATLVNSQEVVLIEQRNQLQKERVIFFKDPGGDFPDLELQALLKEIRPSPFLSSGGIFASKVVNIFAREW